MKYITQINKYDPFKINPKDSLEVIYTKTSINDIEGLINKTLDKHSEICKYYIHMDDNYWGVSFNVQLDQVEVMAETMFEMHLYKDDSNNAIITLSKQIKEHHQWGDVYRSISNFR